MGWNPIHQAFGGGGDPLHTGLNSGMLTSMHGLGQIASNPWVHAAGLAMLPGIGSTALGGYLPGFGLMHALGRTGAHMGIGGGYNLYGNGVGYGRERMNFLAPGAAAHHSPLGYLSLLMGYGNEIGNLRRNDKIDSQEMYARQQAGNQAAGMANAQGMPGGAAAGAQIAAENMASKQWQQYLQQLDQQQMQSQSQGIGNMAQLASLFAGAV